MLITDGPPSSYRDIFKKYNFPHHPVRIFTYLIGKDSSSAHEMHWMACANKGNGAKECPAFLKALFSGYYTRIESFDKINERVLHYIEVLARPMVMYQTDHPIQWTPAYVGGRVSPQYRSINPKLHVLVSGRQLFERQSGTIDDNGCYSSFWSTKPYGTQNFPKKHYYLLLLFQVRVANLLGVVGTDVSIDQIKKLVPSYKVNKLKILFWKNTSVSFCCLSLVLTVTRSS